MLKHLFTLNIVGRGVLTSLFYEDSPILPTPLFSNFVQPPPFPIASNSYPHSLFCCPVSLAEWVIMPFNLMIPWMYTCHTLGP